MRCTKFHSGFKVARHAHAQLIKAMIACQFCQERKIGRRFDSGGWDGHQADDVKANSPCFDEQRGNVGNRASALLIFIANIDLKKACRRSPDLVLRFADGRDQRQPVD